MQIVFHERYLNSNYAMDPAASPGRLEGIINLISKKEEYEIIVPEPATDKDILRAHTDRHLNQIKKDNLLYELSSLAAGGSILAANEGFKGNPTFAVVRPPGHHASANSCWGFCYFNNMSISLLKLFSEKKIRSAFILDFDLHFGDGNVNILSNRKDGFKVKILNPESNNRVSYIEEVKEYLERLGNIDLFAASAGFDQGIADWGNLLYPEDYYELGDLMKKSSEKLCNGRRFALLEGGYNHEVLPKNLDAFCQGFK
ncbi:MAG: histone deacetylase family protein [Promethearchaeota archaeon]|jgi:acetoin utilization deacetylase AcuC-like enzyme